MSDYFTAYRARLERNHKKFMELSEELKAKGCKVFVFSSDKESGRMISYIHVKKEDKHIAVGFAEVPYRWYLHMTLDGKNGQGTGRDIAKRTDAETEYCFTADEIIAELRPYPYANDPARAKRDLSIYTEI